MVMTCPRCEGSGREFGLRHLPSLDARPVTVGHFRRCRMCGGHGLAETGVGDA